MSGGSWDYLCFEDNPTDDVLTRMANRLEDEGYGKLAAMTRSLVRGEIPDPLRQAWKAVEWRDSFDIGNRSMHERLNSLERFLERGGDS